MNMQDKRTGCIAESVSPDGVTLAGLKAIYAKLSDAWILSNEHLSPGKSHRTAANGRDGAYMFCKECVTLNAPYDRQ